MLIHVLFHSNYVIMDIIKRTASRLCGLFSDFGKIGPIWCLFVVTIFIIQFQIPYVDASMTFHEQDLNGEVEAGNYTYYNLKSDFTGDTMKKKSAAMVLLLISPIGDADLYVSRTNQRPTYEHGQHDYQSASCGIDRIDINLNEPNPALGGKRTSKIPTLTVGVYGHPSQPISRYLLKVLLFIDDDSTGYGDVTELRLSDEEYMNEEMLNLAKANQWREWVQQVQVMDDDLSSLAATIPESSTRANGEGFSELLKSIGEILLAVLSFALNVLVEILV